MRWSNREFITGRGASAVAKLKTIEEEWTAFSAMIFAKMNPGPVQVEETRKAFFAGAWAMLTAMRIVGTDEITEDQGVQFFDDRQKEGAEFYRKLMRDYAEGN